MSAGSVVRRALGRFEPTAIRLYRGAFIDLDALASTIASTVSSPKRILEVGCGDGALAAALLRAWPDSTVLGIDPGMAEPGGMFDGDGRAEFRRVSTSDLIAERPEPFDLVVVCDVLHHVADAQRVQVLRDAAVLTAPGGVVAVKEWERSGRFWWIAHLADRWVSCDAKVRFMRRPELDDVVDVAMPGWQLVGQATVRPRRANILLMLCRQNDN
jgi:2-polyprenyl-6-hydroxyphenyl methylase/3-demethylubiquinone-9 3-methyltransferase